MSERTQRRLAAIVSADVVGYSRLMGEDEHGTLEALRAHRSQLIDPKIAEHGGRVVKTMGDGLLLEFPSVVNATQCVLEVQRAMVERNESIEDHRRITFRVGINLGDIVTEGDDIHGDGVNVAARLQENSAPGGLTLSGIAYEGLGSLIDTAFENGGQHQFKNIARPIQVWRWSPQEGEAPAQEMAEVPIALLDKPSIAVLPFNNMSGDSEQEYFADGITEDIITLLSKLRWLFVIARNSTFRYKVSAPDIRQIGRELDVRYVLEGSVRKAGNRVRITAQLVDTSNGRHIWADNYDRELEDVFALQDDIARQISGCLEPEIERAEWRGLSDTQRPNLGSWDQYLRGLARMHEYSRDGNIAAKDYYKKAIELEPKFGHAHAAIANVIFHDVADGNVEDYEQALAEAEKHARASLTIDDQDAFAHCVLGRVYTFQSRYDEAIAESQTAVRLNPSLAMAYHGLGFALLYSGDAEQSISLFETAEKLSPHDHNVWAFLGIRAYAYTYIGEYDAAVRAAREAIRKPHAKFWANAILVSALGHVGETKGARAALEELLRLKPDFNVRLVQEVMRYQKPEQLEHFIDGLRKAGMPEQ